MRGGPSATGAAARRPPWIPHWVGGCIVLAVACVPTATLAHAFSPGTMHVEPLPGAQGSTYQVRWQPPSGDGGALSSAEAPVEWPASCAVARQAALPPWTAVWTVQCMGTDAWIWSDDAPPAVVTIGSGLPRPTRPGDALIPTELGPFASFSRYVRLGVHHLLVGWDHLLFIVLVLVAAHRRRPGWRTASLALLAFTVAHGVTLGLVATGRLRVASAPLEAAVALSIAWLAADLLVNRETWTGISRAPAASAFGFGLLHGAAFAGALTELGLPSGQAMVALAGFHVGLEVAQVAVTAGLLGAVWLARSWTGFQRQSASTAALYGAGAIAVWWLVERTWEAVA